MAPASVSDASVAVIDVVIILRVEVHDAQPFALAVALALHRSEVWTCGGTGARVGSAGGRRSRSREPLRADRVYKVG